jgi:general secretion pathway protein A
MYEAHFGLRERPFDLSPSPRFLVLTESHREALQNLQYGIATRKGLTLLIGEAGSGKTTVIRAAVGSQSDRVHTIHISNPTLSLAEFTEMIADHFGLSPSARHSKAVLLAELECLLNDRLVQGETTVLVLDEAQSMPATLLEEVRLLANIETNEQKLLSIVLAGQPELAERLNQHDLRQLKQRAALRCDIRPLSQAETETYVASRMQMAGGIASQSFTKEAVILIHNASRGLPRTINVLADNALLGAFAAGRSLVDAEAVRAVCRDFDLAPGVVPGTYFAGDVARSVAPPAPGVKLLSDDIEQVAQDSARFVPPLEGHSSPSRSERRRMPYAAIAVALASAAVLTVLLGRGLAGWRAVHPASEPAAATAALSETTIAGTRLAAPAPQAAKGQKPLQSQIEVARPATQPTTAEASLLTPPAATTPPASSVPELPAVASRGFTETSSPPVALRPPEAMSESGSRPASEPALQALLPIAAAIAPAPTSESTVLGTGMISQPASAGSTSPADRGQTAPADAPMLAVVEQYRRAFGTLNASGVNRFWPGVNTRSLQRAFDQISSQEIAFDACVVLPASAERASVSCRGTARFVPKVGGRTPREESRNWTFRLSRGNSGWVIDQVESR